MKKYTNIFNAFLGVLLLISVKFINPVCTGSVVLQSGKKMPMRCHYTSIAAMVIAVAVIVLALELYYRKTYLPITFIIIGILLFLVPMDTPLSIGVCMKPMDCHLTAAWIKGISILLILSGCTTFFLKDKDTKIL
ncbi:DUF4418 family protein [Clostridium sp. CX1]|uniref:DUF4418 family protein n=1 Tax=Clostridium sp. CX1 TaxID=2978346 RepID=UPI0021C02363|nr:DUF4418 family protein [Clostridium sp. CX1]MCT8978752.1 DUF4418 family protein [Clostridium sp. CX1]